MAGQPPECTCLAERARQRRAWVRVDVGSRAERGGGADRRGVARAASARAHCRPDGHSDRSAAQHQPRGPGARHRDSRGGACVTSLSLNARPLPGPQPEPALRPAVLLDVAGMEELMAPFVTSGDLLPRSNYDLCRHIKEYVVGEGHDGAIVGTASLKVYSTELAEVAGLAVRDDQQGRGVGKALVESLLVDARALGLKVVFGLTRKQLFFIRLGFQVAEKEQFPLKVWADCAHCPRQHACAEVAVALTL